MKHSLVVALLGIGLCGASTRTLEFPTNEVTSASITVSPDGQMIVFTMLGHLFSLPVTGSVAQQLTFGPYYDQSPAFSPDGSRLSFISDRDGSAENIYLFAWMSHEITQLTHEKRPERQIWTPDGKSIVYVRRGLNGGMVRIPVEGGQPEIVISREGQIGQPFYLPDARLAWPEQKGDWTSGEESTEIVALDKLGATAVLVTVSGLINTAIPAPLENGFYCHRLIDAGASLLDPGREEIVFISTKGKPERRIAPVTRPERFSIAPDGGSLYIGDQGHLLKIRLPSGEQESLSFQARVQLEVAELTNARRPQRDEGRAISILTPRLSPDGRTVVFGVAGFLWKQPVEGGEKAARISQDTALEGEPAFSPDGRQLAYVRSKYGQDSLQILDVTTGKIRTLASLPSLSVVSWPFGISQLSWSGDGRRILAVTNAGFSQSIECFYVENGKHEQLRGTDLWWPRPQYSSDGRSIYYSADSTGVGNLYRLALDEGAKPEMVTHFSHHASDARVSPDGKWVVFRRNHAILVASLAKSLVADADERELSSDGGDSFALTPDGSSVIYAVSERIWRQPLPGGLRQEIPARWNIIHETAPPLLIHNARILNIESGNFSPPSSILVGNGRIQRIGPDAEQSPPGNTISLDAKGRFAIPGLFDLHTHLSGSNLEAFVAYGITSVRDVGGSASILSAFSYRSDLTGAALPRYFYSGEILEGESPFFGDRFLQIDNERDAREYVRRLKARGATSIKAYESLSWPMKRIVAEEAQRLGLPVIGHGTRLREIVGNVTLGFFSLEHYDFSRHSFDDVTQMLAASGTSWDPTVAVVGGDALLLRENPRLLADPKFRALVPSQFIDFARSSGYFRTMATDELRGYVFAALASIRRAKGEGVHLLLGTDVANPEVFDGASLQWEMERFVEAGLSPLEVIRLATKGAANAVGSQELGSLEQGRLADVVLLDADPLTDIHNTEKIWRVVKNGWLFDPQKLAAEATASPIPN